MSSVLLKFEVFFKLGSQFLSDASSSSPSPAAGLIPVCSYVPVTRISGESQTLCSLENLIFSDFFPQIEMTGFLQKEVSEEGKGACAQCTGSWGKGKEQVLSRAKPEPQGGARILLRQDWGRRYQGSWSTTIPYCCSLPSETNRGKHIPLLSSQDSLTLLHAVSLTSAVRMSSRADPGEGV